MTPTQFLPHAVRLGEMVLAAAQSLPDGSITWGRGFGGDLVPATDAGIFNGRLGEALFFAALFAETGEPAWARAALAALTPLRNALEQEGRGPELVARLGLGLTGMGSIVYAFVRIARFLGRPELVAAARCGAAALTRGAVERDTKHEVCWGSAGAILGLLALAEVDEGDADPLERATWCAEHLLAHRVVDAPTGLRAWAPVGQTVPMSGYAHGSSGTAHALVALHGRTGDRRLYDAAIEVFAFERTLYSDEVADWLDHRDQLLDRVLSGWCHGAAGIGLSRLPVLDVIEPADESDVVGDLYRALRKSARYPVSGVDHLCCGVFGRVDFLLEASRRLGNPSLEEAARRMAARAIEEARGGAGFRIAPPENHPGLWQGLAGIGYGMLRLAAPDRVPSILLLQ